MCQLLALPLQVFLTHAIQQHEAWWGPLRHSHNLRKSGLKPATALDITRWAPLNRTFVVG